MAKFAEDDEKFLLDEDGYIFREDGGITPECKLGKGLGKRYRESGVMQQVVNPGIPCDGSLMRHSHKQLNRIERLGARH